jgi:Flp pilus assembly protein TadG
MRRRASDLRECRSGVSLVEFALALPVVMAAAVGGLECANVALAHLRISQIATTTADTAARVLTQMDETDVEEVFAGVDVMGDRINFSANGRVILSNVEAHDEGNGKSGAKISWQRCHGSLNVASNYGGPSNSNGNAALKDGIGPTGRKIMAGQDTAIMFVEVTYDYQPLFYDILNVGNIRYEAAFNVRERTSFGITNTQSRTVKSC